MEETPEKFTLFPFSVTLLMLLWDLSLLPFCPHFKSSLLLCNYMKSPLSIWEQGQRLWFKWHALIYVTSFGELVGDHSSSLQWAGAKGQGSFASLQARAALPYLDSLWSQVVGYNAAEKRGDMMEISEMQLERQTEAIWRTAVYLQGISRHWNFVPCEKILLKAAVWR